MNVINNGVGAVRAVHILFRHVVTAVLAIGLSACGGGGSGGGDPSPNNGGSSSGSSGSGVVDTTPPTATIDFPHIDGLKSGPWPITVRGSAADDHGVKMVSVNGVQAESSDEFQTWTAEVPLEAGAENELIVKVEDINGNITQRAATRIVSATASDNLSVCGAVNLDSAQGKLFNATSRQVIATDIDTGALTFYPRKNSNYYMQVVYGTASKNFYALTFEGHIVQVYLDSNPDSLVSWDNTNDINFSEAWVSIALDSTDETLYALVEPYESGAASAIYAIDLHNGMRSLVSGDGQGEGVELTGWESIAAAQGRLFASFGDSADSYVLEIDIDSGDRRVVSGAGVGVGHPLGYARGIALDELAEKAYVGDIQDRIVEVELGSGDRRLVSDRDREDSLNSNLVFGQHFGMVADSSRGKLYMSCASHQLVSVDIETGVRSRITQPERGLGPPMNAPSSMRFDEVSGQVLFVNRLPDSYSPQIMAVDPVSGDRKVVSGPGIGEGPGYIEFREIVVSRQDGVIFATDTYGKRIVEIDPESGDRRIISGSGEGMGPMFSSPLGLELSAENDLLYVVDDQLDALFVVDIETGDRQLVSQPGTIGEGPEWEVPAYLALHPEEPVAFVSDQQQSKIYRVNLETGDREIFSSDSDSIGDGPSLAEPTQIRLDPVRGKLIVESYHIVGIQPMVFVDLETGDREYRVSSAAHTGHRAAADPETGLIYLSSWPGIISVYDYEAAQGLIVSW